jgi:hypothetical protein
MVTGFLGERLSAGTAGAGVIVETGRRVKVTESMADRAAPAVVQPRLVRLLFHCSGTGIGVHISTKLPKTSRTYETVCPQGFNVGGVADEAPAANARS